MTIEESGTTQPSEAQIAVHWREEEYVAPPASFIAQANGATGVMYGFYITQVGFFMGFTPGIKAFGAAVLGGIGSVPGATNCTAPRSLVTACSVSATASISPSRAPSISASSVIASCSRSRTMLTARAGTAPRCSRRPRS